MGLNFKVAQALFILVSVPLAFELILIGTSMSIATSPEAAQRFEGLIVTGVVANIALAIALAFYFSRSMQSRMNVLKDNMGRLAKGEPLNPKLRGIDEFAELDEAFHAMAAEVTRKCSAPPELSPESSELNTGVGLAPHTGETTT